jgi:hypothetical protein
MTTANMTLMVSAEEKAEAIRAIVKIIRDQKSLESSQRSAKASTNTLHDSMVYAYDEIVEVIKPFMEE